MLNKYEIVPVIALIVLLAAVIALVVSFRRATAKAYQDLAQVDRELISTSCGSIEVAIEGEGKPVLMVHGSAGGVDQALDLAADVPASHRVIAPSRFGYLGSPLPPKATPSDQAEAFVCLLDALEVDEAMVMAYSAGGPSAVLLAQNYPERVSGLILVSTALADKKLSLPPKPVLSTMAKSDFIFWLISHPLRSLSQRMFVPADLEMSAAARQQVDATMDSLLPIKPRSKGLVFDMYVTNTDTYQRSEAYQLSEIEVPTLIINAKDDPTADFEDAYQMSRRMPNAEFLAIDGGGHMMLDNDRQVQQSISRFFAQVE